MSSLILDTTTKTIKALMSGAAATTNPDVTATWADNTGSVFTEGSTDTALNGTSDVTLVAAPASSTRRIIKSLTIQNRDTAAVTITVKLDNNGTQRTIAKVTLNVGDTWTLDGTYDSAGNLKQATSFPVYNNIQTYAPSAAGTATLDLSKGNIHHITMPAGNITIALSNGTIGQCFIIRILQDSGGSRTVTWFTTIKWAGGSAPTLTTTASKADTVGFEITGSNTYDGFVIGQNI